MSEPTSPTKEAQHSALKTLHVAERQFLHDCGWRSIAVKTRYGRTETHWIDPLNGDEVGGQWAALAMQKARIEGS